MKRFSALVAATATAMLLLAGCSANTTEQSASQSPTADEPTTRVITDHTGEEITIPAEITRVAVDQIPIASTYLAYFGGESTNLVGMSGSVVGALEGTVAEHIAPEILDIDTSYYDNGELNVESLLTLKPDVVLYNASNTAHGELFRAAGIPAVGFVTSGDPATVYADWLRLLEQVFGEPGKMDDVIEYGEELVADARERNATVAEADRKNTLIIFSYSSGTLTVAGEPEFFGSHWLATANANNAAVGTAQPLAQVTAEQVLAWDPDTVLISGVGQSQITPQQVLENTVEGLDLSSLPAVQRGDVFSTGLGMYTWFTPNPDAPLVANWIGAAIYPELYADGELEEMTKEYYESVYNYTLTDEQVEQIFTNSFSR